MKTLINNKGWYLSEKRFLHLISSHYCEITQICIAECGVVPQDVVANFRPHRGLIKARLPNTSGGSIATSRPFLAKEVRGRLNPQKEERKKSEK